MSLGKTQLTFRLHIGPYTQLQRDGRYAIPCMHAEWNAHNDIGLQSSLQYRQCAVISNPPLDLFVLVFLTRRTPINLLLNRRGNATAACALGWPAALTCALFSAMDVSVR